MKSNWLKIALFLLVVGGMYYMIKQKGLDLEALWQATSKALKNKNGWLIYIIVSLTPINWLFESLKWQFTSSKIEKQSLASAYKGILVGLALGFNTPITSGDFAGRIMLLKSKDRLKTIGAILFGNGMQLFATYTFGCIAFWTFYQNHPVEKWQLILVGLVSSFTILGYIVLFKGVSTKLLARKWTAKLSKYFDVMEMYNLSERLKVWSIAISRYAIMILQFVLAFYLFEINLEWYTLAMLSSLILLSKTIFPVINFASDLGVREMATLYFFSFYAVSPAAVSAATLMVWVFNLFIPILLGSLFLWQISLKTK